MKKKILITGASGFIGSQIVNAVKKEGGDTVEVYRKLPNEKKNEEKVLVKDIDGDTDWTDALKNVEVVIHTAAKTTDTCKEKKNILQKYRDVNVYGTINLARQAAEYGVKRFIFISTIKVNGEETRVGFPFKPDDTPCPKDSYGKTKAEAEEGLINIGMKSGMEVTIIRPPVVYGPGVKGNILNLIKTIKQKRIIPLGGIKKNRRSFVGLQNLVDLVITCIDHPQAANQIFLVSDGEDISTTEMIKKISKALNRYVIFVPIPITVISILLEIFGKNNIKQKILGSLQVDISKTQRILNWKPTNSMEDELIKTVRDIN